jgi:hypothetical protein
MDRLLRLIKQNSCSLNKYNKKQRFSSMGGGSKCYQIDTEKLHEITFKISGQIHRNNESIFIQSIICYYCCFCPMQM